MGSRWDRDRFGPNDEADEVTLDPHPALTGRRRALAEGRWTKALAYLNRVGREQWTDGFPLDGGDLHFLSTLPGVTFRVEPPEDTYTIGETAEGWIVYDLGEPLAICLDERAAEELKDRLLGKDRPLPYEAGPNGEGWSRDDNTFDLF